MKKIAAIFFEGFQTLDAMGPIEVLGNMKDVYEMHYVSMSGGPVVSYQGVPVLTESMDQVPEADIILIPGGRSAFDAMKDPDFIAKIREYAEKAEFCLTVCSGSLILACTGLLDGRPATTNKFVFRMVTPDFPTVDWQASARWVHSGKFYTASGVTAGIDMAFAFVLDQFGEERAADVALDIEYVRHKDPNDDPFAV
ncbi:MAG: DJ-1/PfpI family protein [Oscillospiraceae bacterium]|nr:DJ-1/PfpI family protein [Oscillospiraceae bacterium]